LSSPLTSRGGRPDETGAALILAMVFLLAIGVLVVAIGGFATNTVTTSINARTERTSETNAESAVTVAIQQVRTQFAYNSGYGALTYGVAVNGVVSGETLVECSTPDSGSTQGTETQFSTKVFCEGYQVGNVLRGQTRVVDFYACGSSVSSGSACASGTDLVLHAEVTYNDLPAGGGSNSGACNSSTSASCGVSMAIGTWDLRPADN
jgi:Tfp pilus assembly protein PilX